MDFKEIGEIVDTALLEGIIEAECSECGSSIQCASDEISSFCEHCNKVVNVKNILQEFKLPHTTGQQLETKNMKGMDNAMEIVRWDRYFALYDRDQLVCVTVYKKGAQEVKRRIEELKSQLDQSKAEAEEKPIYIIGNPFHRLGFMVVSPDDPLAYDDPAEALSELGQMRQDAGRHLRLFRVVPVVDPVARSADLEKHNADCEVDGFDLSLVEEYLE